MKQVEYTIKVVTPAPIDPQEIIEAIGEHITCTATCTNFRVLPVEKATS